MKNHLAVVRSIFAGVLLALPLLPSSSGASFVPHACAVSCRQTRRACVLECQADNSCRVQYRVGRAECVEATIPGIPRQNCFSQTRVQLDTCQISMANCKTKCSDDFVSCKNGCSVGN
jgi:hypothetical protein